MATDTIINKTEKPNSYEFGKAGNRFKLYFNDAVDLNTQMNSLRALGILFEEPIELKNDSDE